LSRSMGCCVGGTGEQKEALPRGREAGRQEKALNAPAHPVGRRHKLQRACRLANAHQQHGAGVSKGGDVVGDGGGAWSGRRRRARPRRRRAGLWPRRRRLGARGRRAGLGARRRRLGARRRRLGRLPRWRRPRRGWPRRWRLGARWGRPRRRRAWRGGAGCRRRAGAWPGQWGGRRAADISGHHAGHIGRVVACGTVVERASRTGEVEQLAGAHTAVVGLQGGSKSKESGFGSIAHDVTCRVWLSAGLITGPASPCSRHQQVPRAAHRRTFLPTALLHLAPPPTLHPLFTSA
jgi:hypothetical protein